MRIEKVHISKLNPAAYNPRVEDCPAYDKLVDSIDEYGYIDPIIWNCQTGNVVGGHLRLKALQEKGLTEVEVSVVDLDLEREKALNLALNKISGEWDEGKLSVVLKDLIDSDVDVMLTGFDAGEIDLLTVDSDVFASEADLADVYQEPEERKIRCPQCGHVDSKARFVSA